MYKTIEEIEARLAAIREEVDKPDADIDALEKEVRELKELRAGLEREAERRNKLKGEVAGGAGIVVRRFEEPAPKAYDAKSPEYRTAWLKHIAVDERGNRFLGEMNVEERAAFTFLTTNTSAVVPVDIVNRIVELVQSKSPILADATMNYFTRGFGVPRHKEIVAGDAAVVTEGLANPDDEEDTFDQLVLTGVEIKKHIVLSKRLEIQSIDAFETWLVNHLAERIGVAQEKHIISRLDDTAYGIAAENVLTGTLTDTEILKIFSLIKESGAKVIYASATTIWNTLVAMKDDSGNKLFTPNSMVDPIVQGRVYGAAVKEDTNIPDDVIYVGVIGAVSANEFAPLEIVPHIEPKTLNRIYTGYSLFDAGLENPKSFVKYTLGG